jgi:hypothetical protein
MATTSHSLTEAVRIAEAVTEEPIDQAVIASIREALDENAKAQILTLYDDGEISEQATRRLLGDEDFELSQEMATGADTLLSGETSRFVADNDS